MGRLNFVCPPILKYLPPPLSPASSGSSELGAWAARCSVVAPGRLLGQRLRVVCFCGVAMARRAANHLLRSSAEALMDGLESGDQLMVPGIERAGRT